MTKPVLQSKTMLFGGAVTLLGVLQFLNEVPWTTINPTYGGIAAIVIGGSIIALRKLTGQPVTLTGN